jgi:hypothetical protein
LRHTPAEGEHFASINPGLRGYLARQNLAAACRELGRLEEAEMHWQEVLKERPPK